jgi:hypothetical protein
VEESGCLLVRPDGHIGWRAQSSARSAEEAETRLQDAIGKILSRNLEKPVGRPELAAYDRSMGDRSLVLS